MNELKQDRHNHLNPPLRIFNPSTAEAGPQVPTKRFERPQLQRLVKHDIVARYFSRRGVPTASPLD